MTEQQSGEGTKIATPIATPAQDVTVVPQAGSVIEHHPPGRPRVWARRLLILLLVGGGAGFLIWQTHRVSPIPAWIVYGNGRLEADPIDIATKFAGRIAELRADEGDKVTAGQIVAVMDTRDLAQSLKTGRGRGRAGAARDRRGARQPCPGPDHDQTGGTGDRPHAGAGQERLRHPGIAGPAPTGARRRPRRCKPPPNIAFPRPTRR